MIDATRGGQGLGCSGRTLPYAFQREGVLRGGDSRTARAAKLEPKACANYGHHFRREARFGIRRIEFQEPEWTRRG